MHIHNSSFGWIVRTSNVGQSTKVVDFNPITIKFSRDCQGPPPTETVCITLSWQLFASLRLALQQQRKQIIFFFSCSIRSQTYVIRTYLLQRHLSISLEIKWFSGKNHLVWFTRNQIEIIIGCVVLYSYIND